MLRFFAFAALFFAPMLLFLLFVLLPLILINVGILLLPGQWETGHARSILLWLFLFLIPFGLMAGRFRLCCKVCSTGARGLIFYATWLLMMFVVGLFVSAMFHGFSMAVADGALRGLEELASELWAALVVVGFANLFIIPWTLVSLWMTKRVPKLFGNTS